MNLYKDIVNFGHEEAGRASAMRRDPGGLRPNALHEDELIEQAIEAFEQDRLQDVFVDEAKPTLVEACEAFYMNGCADAVGGNVDSPQGHFYRVHRWIVITDEQGFKDIETWDNETEAIVAFEHRADEYTQWAGEDE